MNEESKDDKSVVGKAIKFGAVAGTAYGVKTALRNYRDLNPEGRKVYGSYNVMKEEGAEATSNILKAIDSAPSPNLLKKGLSPEALANQVHLDNLRNASKDKRASSKTMNATGGGTHTGNVRPIQNTTNPSDIIDKRVLQNLANKDYTPLDMKVKTAFGEMDLSNVYNKSAVDATRRFGKSQLGGRGRIPKRSVKKAAEVVETVVKSL